MEKKVVKITRIKSNLYGPAIDEQKRRDSLVGLMEDIAARRDHWANINGKETAVRWSFCVGPDTNILTNKGYFKASEVEELNKDSVLLWNGSSFVKKESWISSGKQRCFLVKLSDGVIIVSYNHPFRVKGQPVFVSDLKPGMILDINQTIPEQIWSEEIYELGTKAQLTAIPIESYQSFLKGLLDNKARVENERLVFSLRSLGDAEQVLLMLEALGLYGTLSGKIIQNISEVTLSKFSTQKCLGTLSCRNTDILKDIIRTNTDLEYSQDTRIVVSVEELEDQIEVFGPVNVEGGWYLSNGVISHNTPFTAKNQTPLEYADCMGGLTNKKTLTPAVEASRKLGFKFRVGTAQEISTVAQVLTLGDRRLNKVIYRAYKEGILQYFGGMSVGKNILDAFAQLLKEETGHTYETYAQEKSLFQVFPWDFIDLGMTKEYRKERYLQSKEAALPDFSCFTHCIQCGACQTSQSNLPRLAKGGNYVPAIWRKENKIVEETLEDVKVIVQKAKKTDIQRFILEFYTDEPLRFLDRSKVKLYIQRAFIRINVDARKKKVLFTDQFRFQNWTYGQDYCIGQLTENVTGREDEILQSLKENLDSLGIHPTRFEVYSMNLKPSNVFEKVVYEIQTDFDFSKVQAEISNFDNASEFLVKVKVPGLMQDSWVTKEVNAKEHVSDIWAEQVQSELGIFTVIRLISSGNIGLYEILPTLLHTSAKNIKRFPVKRLAYLKANDDAEFDLFADTCEVCGKQIEKNVFDEPISSTRCARHMDYNSSLVKLGKELDEEADREAEQIEAQEGLYLDSEGNVFDEEMLSEA